MFAIAEIKGHQYKVAEGDKVQISFMEEAKEGDKVKFDEVLLISDKEVTLGMPFIAGAYIEVKVLGEFKDKKLRIFKMKPKKRYRKTQGHRQMYTEVEVVKVALSGGTKAPVKKVEAKEAPIKEEKVVEAKAEKKAPAKKPATKKAE
ncbi:MAG: 50S ribosomal protein L21 [Candidatus Peregrinibacteria bacterium]|nr:50S ribosomal protein L21 [Candidatus Peregrinibacteria bacterium]MDZ4245078.1 50S ribosomal protein L21 [Candidatus Gracilibacteria bacterium]